MNTSIIAQPKVGVCKTSSSSTSEILRTLGKLSNDDLLKVQSAIAGWLEGDTSPDSSAAASTTKTARGWLERQYKPVKKKGKIVEGQFYGPYYVRCFWGPMVDGDRKKIKIYLGKHPESLVNAAAPATGEVAA